MYRKAFKYVWIIYSVCGLALLLLALFVPPQIIVQNTPACYSIKQLGKECFMCGATRSFIRAGSGNFAAAIQFNRLAFALFIILIANTAVLLYYVTNNYLTNKNLRR